MRNEGQALPQVFIAEGQEEIGGLGDWGNFVLCVSELGIIGGVERERRGTTKLGQWWARIERGALQTTQSRRRTLELFTLPGFCVCVCVCGRFLGLVLTTAMMMASQNLRDGIRCGRGLGSPVVG